MYNITAFQLRAARAGLKLKLKYVSNQIKISHATLCKIENEDLIDLSIFNASTIKKLTQYYESWGIKFGKQNTLYFKENSKTQELPFLQEKKSQDA